MPSAIISKAEVRDVRVSEKTLWRHVVLRTLCGLAGFGEATLDAAPHGFHEMLEAGAQSLVGKTVERGCLEHMAGPIGQGIAAATVYSALDQAVLDLMSQLEDVPLWRAVGGEAVAHEVPLYANINRATEDRTPSGFARNAGLAVERGFGTLKLAPFDRLTPSKCEDERGNPLIEAGIARIAAVRAAAPSAEIRVDCHWRFTMRQAERLIDALSEIGVSWIECPLIETPDAIPALRDLRRRANARGMRFAGLETFAGWASFEPYIHGGAYDVVMPDVKHAGGCGAIMEIARRAKENGVAVSLHNPSGPIAHQVSVHVSAAIASSERLELQWNESPLFFKITDPKPSIDGDIALVSDAPGLGARLRDEIPSLERTFQQ